VCLLRISLFVLGIAFAMSVGWTAYSPQSGAEATLLGNNFSCTVASVTDGDTFRCAETGADGRQIRVRLAGIAARERDGTCLVGHPCPTASADAATAEMERLASGQVLSCDPNGTTFGRIAAFCVRSDGTDLSCAMIESGTVERWDRYWGAHRC
jgi:endonuclease YncB( thermonuclease family)